METIIISHPNQLTKNQLPPSVMALGYFDGIHLGHQKVIQTAKKIAAQHGVASALMSFHPHPSVVLGKQPVQWTYLTPLEEKKELLEKMGIDRFYLVTFDLNFASLSPETFIEDYIEGLNVIHAVTGFDFTYGQFGKGNTASLLESSKERFGVTIVDKVERNGEKVSSTLIRHGLSHGEVAEVMNYLGRRYSVSGTVIAGDQRGRTIGFPTANLNTGLYTLPAVGVYAVKAEWKGRIFEGMANIGFKPTFHTQTETPTLEVHLFDFNEMIYGDTLKVEWIGRIRSEAKFSSIDHLVAQLKEDKEKALELCHSI